MAKKNGELGLNAWLRQDTVLGYIINAYVGVEPARTGGVMRRMFVWESEDGRVKGNAEAFMIHLGKRFERKIGKWDASALHELLRDLGDSITPHPQHSPPQADSPRVGRFKQPEPDEWVIRPSPDEK